MTGDPLVALLADLVAIPSVNPMGRERTGTDYGERGIADYVAAYLRRHGVDCEVDEVVPGRPNVIGRIDAGAPATILLEAHLDTVHVDTMTIPPFTPEVRRGRLYGRGSCDTKGSLAAFLFAACGMLAQGKKPGVNVVLAAVADEEYQFTGALHAVARGLKADFGIAGEPTQLHIVRAHKGVTRWKIVTRGLSAHSAYPTRGKNAIYTMGRILTRLEDYALELGQEPPHPLLGPPSLSVGVIEGGQAVNIVPDTCVIEIDRRTLPGESIESVLAPVRRLLKEIPGWEIVPPHLAVEPMEVPRASRAVALIEESVAHVTGTATVEGANYATDAGIYNRAGIPTIVFGPGDIAHAHTHNESIDLAELHAASSIIHHLLSQRAGAHISPPEEIR